MPDSLITMVIAPESKLYMRLAREVLLAGFGDLHERARQVEQESWARANSRPGAGERDAADMGLDALEAGVEHYIALWNLRQGTYNLLATMFYHLFEQQMERYKESCQRWRKSCVDWKGSVGDPALPSSGVVDELRLVANAAKHGEGPAVNQLRDRRPDLFNNPMLAEAGMQTPRAEVRSPYAGDGLFVKLSDLDSWEAGVHGLWLQMAAWHASGKSEVNATVSNPISTTTRATSTNG